MKTNFFNICRIYVLSKITSNKKQKHYKDKFTNIKNDMISKYMQIITSSIKESLPENNDILSKILYASSLHKDTFEKYKNQYTDQSVAIIASGPSLNYANEIKCDCIGVNRAFLHPTIKIKYLFAIDYMAIKSYIEEILKYPDIEKFYGYFYTSTPYTKMMIPDSVALRHNAQRFVSMPIWYDNEQRNFGYNPDIARMPLHGYSSSVFCALQFAFYTNPKKIYLYGCDTSDAGHAYGANKKITSDNILLMKKEWNIIKKIAPVFYPETEIISVNPVGLKGMFHDVYTKSYLQDHPEIDIQKVEILE